MSVFKCPGAVNIGGTPTLEIKNCPVCGGEVEMFSNERQASCRACGFVVYNDVQSCIRWCDYAAECVGEDKLRELLAGD